MEEERIVETEGFQEVDCLSTGHDPYRPAEFPLPPRDTIIFYIMINPYVKLLIINI